MMMLTVELSELSYLSDNNGRPQSDSERCVCVSAEAAQNLAKLIK